MYIPTTRIYQVNKIAILLSGYGKLYSSSQLNVR